VIAQANSPRRHTSTNFSCSTVISSGDVVVDVLDVQTDNGFLFGQLRKTLTHLVAVLLLHHHDGIGLFQVPFLQHHIDRAVRACGIDLEALVVLVSGSSFS